MSGPIILTGFRPYSPLTKATGNPSEQVVTALAAKYGTAVVQALILSADQSGLQQLSIGLQQNPNPVGIVMLGANLQVASVVMELEGAHKSAGILGSSTIMRSSAASKLEAFARANGVAVGTAPISPLISWCLRSYALALAHAEPRALPCVFLHLNTLRFSGHEHQRITELFIDRLRSGR